MNKIIAHRGKTTKKIKENTYLAIINAINDKNISGVEFDIRLSKDNKIVIIHDNYINRTSNGSGSVENMSLKELQKYNYGTKDFYQTIPTLDKILKINTNKILLIEVKTNKNNKLFANILLKTLKNYNKNNIYITSFNKRFLNYLKKTNLNIGPLIFNNNIKNKRYNFYILNYLTFKDKTITKLKKQNKKIFIWSLIDKDIDNYNNLYLIKNIN